MIAVSAGRQSSDDAEANSLFLAALAAAAGFKA